MKTICSLLASVLLCTLVSARGTDVAPASSVVITNIKGSNLFKLHYKSVTAGRVKVSIANADGEMVFKESFSETDAFIRPYNFEELPYGKYMITVEDEGGRTVEQVDYKVEKVEKLIHVVKVNNEPDKYLLSILSEKPEDVFIYIFDETGKLIYNEIQTIDKDFAQVYNLKEIKSFTLEVWDKNGELKKFVNF